MHALRVPVKGQALAQVNGGNELHVCVRLMKRGSKRAIQRMAQILNILQDCISARLRTHLCRAPAHHGTPRSSRETHCARERTRVARWASLQTLG